MKKLILVSLFISFSCYSQCKKETIERENYYYEGCINYEEQPNGEGIEILTIDDQTQKFTGTFKNGVFISGELSISFLNGEISKIYYEDFVKEIISKEIYTWDNGNKEVTIYKNGKKEKEIRTFSEPERQGLIIEKQFKSDGSIIETRNTNNNRIPEDILGDETYIDVDLIEESNQLRVNVDFPTKNGELLSVPIQFDSGATDFFIGYRLYQEIKNKCDVVDLNVEGNSRGVSGEYKTKYIKIKQLKIGSYLVKNVVAIVPMRSDINSMLIGIGFLKKFKEVEWSLNSNKMRFYK